MNAIKISYDLPSKHRKGWFDTITYEDYQSGDVASALRLVKELHPDATNVRAELVTKK